MTSKNSFWKLSLMNLKKRIPFLVICFLVCFFAMPVATYLYAADMASSNRWLSGVIPLEEMIGIKNTMVGMVAFESGIHAILAMGMALLFGISAFAWNNVQKKVDFYKALPVKERTRYIYIHLNNLWMFFICYGLNLVLANLALAMSGLYTPICLLASAYDLLLHTLLFLVTYSVVVIAQHLTGNVVLGVLGSFVLGFMEPLVRIIADTLASCFFGTYSNSTFGGFFGCFQTGFTSPVTGFLKAYISIALATTNFYEAANYSGIWTGVLQMVIQIVVYGLIAYLLYKKRPGHAGNNNIIFGISKPIIKCIIMIPGALVVALLFYSMGHANRLGTSIFGLISGLIIFQIIMQFSMEGDFKMVVRGLKSLIFSTLVSGVILGAFMGDWFGYDSYLPKVSDIDNIAFLCGDAYVYNFYSSDIGYTSTTDYLLENMKIRDRFLVGDFVSMMSEAIQKNEYTYDNSWNISEDGGARREVNYVQVKYQLKNGKKIYRNYLLDRDAVQQFYYKLYDDADYRQVTNQLKQKKAVELLSNDTVYMQLNYSDYTLADQSYITLDMQQDEEKCREVINALSNDHDRRTSAVIQTEVPIGTMHVIISNSDIQKGGYYGKNVIVDMPIYPSDRETIAALGSQISGNKTLDITKTVAIRIFREADLSGYVEDREYATAVEEYDATGSDAENGEMTSNMPGMISGYYSYGQQPYAELTPECILYPEVLENCFLTESLDHAPSRFNILDERYSVEIVLRNGGTSSAYIRQDKLPKEIADVLEELKHKATEK